MAPSEPLQVPQPWSLRKELPVQHLWLGVEFLELSCHQSAVEDLMDG